MCVCVGGGGLELVFYLHKIYPLPTHMLYKQMQHVRGVFGRTGVPISPNETHFKKSCH